MHPHVGEPGTIILCSCSRTHDTHTENHDCPHCYRDADFAFRLLSHSAQNSLLHQHCATACSNPAPYGFQYARLPSDLLTYRRPRPVIKRRASITSPVQSATAAGPVRSSAPFESRDAGIAADFPAGRAASSGDGSTRASAYQARHHRRFRGGAPWHPAGLHAQRTVASAVEGCLRRDPLDLSCLGCRRRPLYMRSRISRARGMTRFGRSAMISTPMSVIAAPTIMRRSSRSPSSNTPSTTVKTGDIRISGAIILAS
jgi:hypothetical protein